MTLPDCVAFALKAGEAGARPYVVTDACIGSLQTSDGRARIWQAYGKGYHMHAFRTAVRLRASRDGLPTELARVTQVMCDAMRRSQGCSTCELCDEPCLSLEAVAAARTALRMGGKL